jgi:hypothetical protein
MAFMAGLDHHPILVKLVRQSELIEAVERTHRRARPSHLAKRCEGQGRTSRNRLIKNHPAARGAG